MGAGGSGVAAGDASDWMPDMQGLDLSEQQQGLERRVVVVRIRLADDAAVAAALDHMAGLARAPLKLGGGLGAGGGWLKVTQLSDGVKAVKDWRHLVYLVMSAMLACMQTPVPSQPSPPDQLQLAVPIHSMVRRDVAPLASCACSHV